MDRQMVMTAEQRNAWNRDRKMYNMLWLCTCVEVCFTHGHSVLNLSLVCFDLRHNQLLSADGILVLLSL